MRKIRVPSYTRYSSGQARVAINGRDFLSGPYGSKASQEKYERLIAEWLASDKSTAFGVEPKQLTVSELLLAYVKHCKKYFGVEPTSEFHRIKPALSAMRKLYGSEKVANFGTLQSPLRRTPCYFRLVSWRRFSFVESFRSPTMAMPVQ